MSPSILVPLEDSSQSERALSYATALAAAGGGGLSLLQVIGDEQLRPRAELVLNRIVEQLASQPIAVDMHIDVGNAAQSIVQYARRTQPDLIVMATDRWSDVDRWLNGSVADWVLRHTRTPVVLIGPNTTIHDWSGGHGMTVLVPLDASTFAEEVLDPAMSVARLLHANVLLLRAADESEAVQTTAREYVDSVAAHFSQAGVHIATQVASGAPDVAIQQAVQSAGVGLIAMATHGRTGLARLVLGSVATRTLQHATVPVLLVRPVAMHQDGDSAATPPSFSNVGVG